MTVGSPPRDEPGIRSCYTDRVRPDVFPNVLAARYASAAMRHLWSPERKIVLERELWIAVMETQRALGVDVPVEAIEAYRRVVDRVDLASIEAVLAGRYARARAATRDVVPQ